MAIHWAVRSKNLELVNWMVNVDQNLIDSTGNKAKTPLIVAAKEGDLEMVKLLM